MTDRKVFETRDIVVFENGEYKACAPPSRNQINSIMKNLTEEERAEFKIFLSKYFNWSEA